MTKTVVDYSKKPRWIISFVCSKKETLGRIMQIRFCQVRTWVEPDGAAIRVRFKYLEPETLRFRFEVPTFGTWIGPFWGLAQIVGKRKRFKPTYVSIQQENRALRGKGKEEEELGPGGLLTIPSCLIKNKEIIETRWYKRTNKYKPVKHQTASAMWHCGHNANRSDW